MTLVKVLTLQFQGSRDLCILRAGLPVAPKLYKTKRNTRMFFLINILVGFFYLLKTLCAVSIFQMKCCFLLYCLAGSLARKKTDASMFSFFQTLSLEEQILLVLPVFMSFDLGREKKKKISRFLK